MKPLMKDNEYWALYNTDMLAELEKTHIACKKKAEAASGEPWSVCKDYFKIIKVAVVPVKAQPL